MTIAAGERLGPYEIVSPLGAGGMGEVYRARDPRLAREVAIKVLPAALSSDEDRVRRFEKEAKAASSLNHPSIVTIYEVGREGAVSYLVMELIEGQTLREILSAGPLPLRRLLSISAQLAEGLARAHGAGIVHRDLKPENVMLTRGGLVKILDFGLARIVAPEPDHSELTSAATVSAATEPGIVMGTVGYMSPEQARGDALDFRSDQFSLGAVLYEMAVGRRAFSGGTRPEVLAAIIREEPQPIGSLNARVPAPIRWIVDRCLAKDPQERYASTEDLARDLRAAETHLSEITGAAAALPVGRTAGPGRMALALAAAILAGAALGIPAYRLLSGRARATGNVPRFQRITFQRENVLHARFAPDGQTVLYSSSREGRPTEIFSTRIDGTESRSLGFSNADLFGVSSSGDLLLLRKTSALRAPNGLGTLARASLSGGASRDIVEDVHNADWLKGGGIVVQHHLAEGHDELQFLPGTRRIDFGGDAPRVSLDGRFVAVGRETADFEGFEVLDTEGRKVWSAPASSEQMAWHPNGEIWYSREAGRDPGVFALGRGRSDRPILRASGWILHDIAPDGRVLGEHGSGRYSLRVRIAGEDRDRELSWLDGSSLVGVSTESRTVLFNEVNQAGVRAGGVYVRPFDGSAAVRLADGRAWAFSEDGRWAFVCGRETPPRCAFVPSSAGLTIPTDVPGGELAAAVFLPGSEPRLLASVGKSTQRSRIDLVTASGSRPLGITPGFWPNDAAVSPDGRMLAYGTGPKEFSLCELPTSRCRKISPGGRVGPVQWSADGRSLFLRDRDEIPTHISRYDIATGALRGVLTLEPENSSQAIQIDHVFVARDGRTYAFDSLIVYESSLYVVEGLK